MKIMKYLDFALQSLMFFAVLLILGSAIGDRKVFSSLLGMQLLIGPWQIVSSLIAVGLRRVAYKLNALHLLISAIYLSVLFISPFGRLSQTAIQLIFTVPAWMLAIFQYGLTLHATFRRPARLSSFLPHTSF